MIVGLDKTFKPEWVYKTLKLAKPGTEYKDKEPEILSIITFEGPRAKKQVLTILRRYYLQIEKKGQKEYFKDNYLHTLTLKYSYESLKPLLLFVLLAKCEIARLIQKKISLMFNNDKPFDSKLLLKNIKQTYGDRRIIGFAVNYYLTILSYFDILNKNGSKYIWKNRKLNCQGYVIKDTILLYAKFFQRYEIDTRMFSEEIAFSLLDLSNMEDILKEYNSKDWFYQKRLDSNKIIVTNKV